MDSETREALREGERLGLRHALQIPRTTLAGLTGSLLGRRAGSSIEFQDYRDYQPGDDVRAIDWGVYARSDRLSVRLFREEVTPHLDLIVDGSRSMDLENTAKRATTAKLAAILATAAANAHCGRAVWLSGEGFQRLANDGHAPSSWDGLDWNGSRTMDEAFDILSPRLRRLSVRVLISDLLWPGNPAQTLRRLGQDAAALFVIQLLAREEASAPRQGAARLVDAENDEILELYIDAAVEKQYLDALRRHQQAWDTACRQSGARLATIIAEEMDESLESLQALSLLTPL